MFMCIGRILYLIAKHSEKLKQSVNRKSKLFYYRHIYGNQFQIGDIRFKKGFFVSITNGGTIKIGNHVFFNNNCSINVRVKVTIGDDCCFGENVRIYDHNHRYEDRDVLICDQGFTEDEVVIEEDCWIASNVTILKGVHIGKHSVVGAGVVVYKDLPAYSITFCKQDLITQNIK